MGGVTALVCLYIGVISMVTALEVRPEAMAFASPLFHLNYLFPLISASFFVVSKSITYLSIC